MLQQRAWFSVLLGLALLGCSDRSLPHEPSFSAANRSSSPVEAPGCYSVYFHQRATPIAPFTFQSVISGDIVGTQVTTFDPGSLDFHGATLHNEGTAHWAITGGIVPGLGSFDTEFDNMNFFVDRPGSPASVIENIGRHRATGGVRKANFEYDGEFSALPEPVANHDFRGVICP